MEFSIDCIEKVTIILDKPRRILRAFCVGPVNNSSENDYYNSHLNNIFANNNIVIKENQKIEFKNGEQHNIFYFDKTNSFETAINFSEFVLTDVFCKNFLHKVASNFCIVLQIHFPQSCKLYFPQHFKCKN